MLKRLSQVSVNAPRLLRAADLRSVVSEEVGFERDARRGLGGGVSAASFSVQTLLVSFDGGFQTRLQVRRRRDERPGGRTRDKVRDLT